MRTPTESIVGPERARWAMLLAKVLPVLQSQSDVGMLICNAEETLLEHLSFLLTPPYDLDLLKRIHIQRDLIGPTEVHSAPAIIVLDRPSDALEHAGRLAEYIARLRSACQRSGTSLFVLEDGHEAVYPVLKYYSRMLILKGGHTTFGLFDREGNQLSVFETQPDGTLVWQSA